MHTKIRLTAATVLLLLPALLFGTQARAAEKARLFASPQEAAQALAEAAKNNNSAELSAILGTAVAGSGDQVADAADRKAFAASYEEKRDFAPLDDGKRRVELRVGPNDWPFPMPIVRDAKSGKWHFDAASGGAELLNRRIGRNELAAMQVCLAYADAQWEYRHMNPDKAARPHFAAKIASSPGKRDGLYWEDTQQASPLGKLVANAETKGYSAPKPEEHPAYHGYRYRVLAGQGEHAPGGAFSYVENGNMITGFALLAYPDVYGVTGVMSFMINQDGLLFEKNLGKDTAKKATSLSLFEPDAGWRRVDMR